jgi:hypothetical protein
VCSATSIVALFDLFCRTFGDGHITLCLAYTVYTAASIFLLEVHAVGYAAPSALDRLSYCVEALERLKGQNPGDYQPQMMTTAQCIDTFSVIETASNLIRKELEALRLHVPIQPFHNAGFPFIRQPPPTHNPPVVTQTFLPLLPLPTNIFASSNVSDMHTSSIMSQEQAPVFLDASYFNTQLASDMDYNILDMPPEMFEAFSHIEPISVTMNPGFDLY